MQNPSGTPKPNVPQPYGTPDAGLVVFAGDQAGRRAAALNTLTEGTPVIAAGMVQEIREHGDVDSPRATFQLVNEFGQAAYAAASTDVLTEYSMCLMGGLEVTVHGVARQPFAEDPRTTYISVTSVEPLFA
jgi:hypothetical protein